MQTLKLACCVAAALVLTFPARSRTPAAARARTPEPQTAAAQPTPRDESGSLRRSFGKASHVLTAVVNDATAYTRTGQRLDDIPAQLGRRQYVELELSVVRTLSPAGEVLPGKIYVRLEAPGAALQGLVFLLLKERKLFFLKKDLRLADSPFYYPADPTLFFADEARAADVGRWAKLRAEQTPAPPKGAKGYYHVPGSVQRVLQEGAYDCWAAAAAMMLSWRDQTNYTTLDAARAAGPEFVRLLAAKGSGGIGPTPKREFLSRLGLVAEAPQTFTAEGLRDLIREHGPLWVTVNQGEDDDPDFLTPHARVVVAIEGDDSPNGTFLIYLDPDPFADKQRESLQEFTRTFELVARGDLKRAGATEQQPFRPQILHF